MNQPEIQHTPHPAEQGQIEELYRESLRAFQRHAHRLIERPVYDGRNFQTITELTIVSNSDVTIRLEQIEHKRQVRRNGRTVIENLESEFGAPIYVELLGKGVIEAVELTPLDGHEGEGAHAATDLTRLSAVGTQFADAATVKSLTAYLSRENYRPESSFPSA
jgi:hypothetical protein